MNHKAAIIAMLLAALAGPAGSATPELGMDIMQSIEDLNKSLASNIALRDAKGGTADAKELDTLLSVISQSDGSMVEFGDGQTGHHGR